MKKHSIPALWSTLGAVLLVALPQTGHTGAGVAQFTFGEVQVQRTGNSAAVQKGDVIESGDVLNTGPQGRAQIKFTDGGIMSLAPDSQLVIQRYSDTKDGSQDSFLVNFVRGGLRAVTGLIGKRNRDNYKVQTSASTIGIRGSGFSSAYNPDGTVSVSGELDEIEVCTQAGCVGLARGQTAIVQDNKTLPQVTSPQAQLVLPDLRQSITISGNNVNSDGSAAIVPPQSSCTNTNQVFSTSVVAAVSVSPTCITNGFSNGG